MATGVGPPNPNRCRDERSENLQQGQPPVRSPRVIKQPHRGGYECEFLERPPKTVQCECPVCLLVLREPHQATCCGYSFCETCVKRVKEDKKCCPTCNKADFNIFANKGLQRSLNEYHVYCCQRREGCDWVGELAQLNRHLNLQPPPEKLLVGCQFVEVNCTYCVQPFQRHDVQTHQSDDCPKRPYTCQHCNKYADTFEAVTQNHWPVCPFFPLSCPNNCELVLQRQQVEDHVSQDCPLTLVQCNFHVVGCHKPLKRMDVPSHMGNNLTGHMTLLQVHITTHPEESMAPYLSLTVGSFQKVMLDKLHEAHEMLRENSGKLKQSLDQLQVTCDELQQAHVELAAINDEKKQLHHKLEECYTQLEQHQQSTTAALDQHKRESDEKLRTTKDEFSKTLTASENWMQIILIVVGLCVCLCVGICWNELTEMLSANEQKMYTQNATLSQLELTVEKQMQQIDQQLREVLTASENEILTRVNLLEKVTYTGPTLPFEFTMTEFDQYKRTRDEWYSPSFYTSTYGYRMCIKVWANGYLSGQGTHLSVSGYLMLGPFDDELKWPFQGAIILQLLNQLEDSNHHTRTINFANTKDPKYISRVTSDERALDGWGYHTYLPHTQLGLNTDKNTQFLKDNQLKFRVSMQSHHIHSRCLA